jgi:hypothetical protein
MKIKRRFVCIEWRDLTWFQNGFQGDRSCKKSHWFLCFAQAKEGMHFHSFSMKSLLFTSFFVSFSLSADPCLDALQPSLEGQITASLARLNEMPLTPQEFDQEAAKVAIVLVQTEASELIARRRDDLATLEQEIERARACGEVGTCWIKKLKKFSLQLSMLHQVVWDGLSAEGKAKVALLKEIEAMAALGVNADQAEANWLRRDKHRLLTVDGFVSKFVDSVKAFRLTALRENPIARANLKKDLQMVLGYQLFGQASLVAGRYSQAPYSDVWGKLLQNPNIENVAESLKMVSATTEWPIFLNTILLMSLQENQAAKHQFINVQPDQRKLARFEGLLLELPKLMQGELGYWTEAKIKMFSFMSLLPFEWAAINAFSMIKMAVNNTGVTNLPALGEMALVNGLSLAIFGSYLSVKWALLEKFVNLGLLPQYQKGTRQVAEDSLEVLKAQNPLPSGLTLREFGRLYYAHSPKAGTVRHWRSKLLLALKKSGRSGAGSVELTDADLARVLSTPAAEKVISDYRRANATHAQEWTWRSFNRAFDATFVFGLFGNIVPKLLGVEK